MRHESLTTRERHVMALITDGLLNKQVGASLGISEITVKAHRGRMMKKMGAATLPDLVGMLKQLEAAPARFAFASHEDHRGPQFLGDRGC